MESTQEINFDGLVGPTHNYAGLSLGNLASQRNAHRLSHPKAAALQGLDKMLTLHKLGVPQGFFPPQQRPAISTLRRLGFSGNDRKVIEKVFQFDPNIAIACYSASSMWNANAATVAPSPDTPDRKLHLTPANLLTNFHRSIEPKYTKRCLEAIFSNKEHFTVHDPLPFHPIFSDEGAANHTRLCSDKKEKGLHLFTYGRSTCVPEEGSPKVYPARQSFEASQAIARLHGLSDEEVVFAQQNPELVDLGVFHNDVISVGHTSILFFHEQAWANRDSVLKRIQEKFSEISDTPLTLLEVKSSTLSVERSVRTYLFNSQLVTLPDGSITLVAPEECLEDTITHTLLKSYQEDPENPIQDILFIPLRESMKNGGGPACLRLRVELTKVQLQALPKQFLLNEKMFDQLKPWIEKHYRDILTLDDLSDPLLIEEVYSALDELTKILDLGNFYPFQNV